MTFKIEKAVRKAIPLLAMLYGKSGSGKTYSALKIAQGLLDDPINERVCLIDSENGRASYYSDEFDFDVINIEPPHTPARYLEAFKLAESKYKVIIIDSLSLVWDGEGSCCDMAERGKGLNAWLVPKKQHSKLTNAIYASKAHKIICCRAKDLLEQKKGEIINKGLVPICEKGVPYEMLITFELDNGITKVKKCIKGLQNKIHIDKYLTPEHAKIIKTWINEGEKIDQILIDLKNQAKEQAYCDLKSLEDWFMALSGENKRIIKPFMEQYKQLAEPDIDEKKENFFQSQVKQSQPPSIDFDFAKEKLEGNDTKEDKLQFWSKNLETIKLWSGEQRAELEQIMEVNND